MTNERDQEIADLKARLAALEQGERAPPGNRYSHLATYRDPVLLAPQTPKRRPILIIAAVVVGLVVVGAIVVDSGTSARQGTGGGAAADPSTAASASPSSPDSSVQDTSAAAPAVAADSAASPSTGDPVYDQERADFVQQVEQMYFAANCGKFQVWETNPWLSLQEVTLVREGSQAGFVDYQAADMVKAAAQRGKARDLVSGECQYWDQNPMELSLLRHELNAAMGGG